MTQEVLEISHPHIKSRNVKMEIASCDRFILDGDAGYIKNYNGSRDTMLELGSHVGCGTLFFAAEKGFKRIMAVEAFFENFRLLVRNVYGNRLENAVTPMWAAIALKTGEFRRLFWAGSRLNHGQYGTFFRDDRHINAGFAQTIGFEHVLSLFDTIDVLKVDIEGGEYEIFSPRDSLKDALRRVRFLELEAHGPNGDFFEDDRFARYGYPHQETANGILKRFLKDCGFDLEFRGEEDRGMQGYNRNFKGWMIFGTGTR